MGDSSDTDEDDGMQQTRLRSRKHCYLYEQDRKFMKNKIIPTLIKESSPSSHHLKINNDMLGYNIDLSSFEYFEPKPKSDNDPLQKQKEEYFCRMQNLVDSYSQI